MNVAINAGAPGYALPLFVASRHVMLDLETWGTTPGCGVRSIGAVVFDPYNEGYAAAFYRNIARSENDKWGLKFDPATEKWWGEQSPEARAALELDQRPLLDTLREFGDWYTAEGAGRVWCHGASFDAPILEAAYSAIGGKAPWGFRDIRDTRTVYDLAGVDLKSARHGTLHNALDDAISQALAVQAAYHKLGIGYEKIGTQ